MTKTAHWPSSPAHTSSPSPSPPRGWGGDPTTGRLWLDTLIADVLATLVVFGFSRAYRNSSFYDAYWSVIPPLLLFYWWIEAGPDVDALRCTLVAVVVVLWAIRLTFNWIRGFPGLHHEDWRYPMFRERAGRLEFLADLVAIHLIPTVQVFVGMLPVYVAVTRPGAGLPWLAWLAAFIGVAAVVLEFVADQQMYRLRQDPQARRGHGPRAVELVAAPELLRGVQLLVRAGAVRRRGGAGRRMVAVRRSGHHAGAVPRRQHPDDGGAQRRAADPSISR